MIRKYVYSFLIGILFFVVAYLLIEINIFWSILIAIFAFLGGRLILQDNDMLVTLKQINTKSELEESEKNIKEIKKVVIYIDDEDIKGFSDTICKLSKKILNSLKTNPKNINASYTFLNYYLPVTLKLISRYEKLENQNLTSKESQKITVRIKTLLQDIIVSFENHLNRIYNNELEDMDAEIDVFNAVLKSDGLLNDSIMKGVDKYDHK